MSENTITERTPITIGLVIVILGGIFWLSNIQHQGSANAASIKEIKTDLREDINRLEGKIDTLLLR